MVDGSSPEDDVLLGELVVRAGFLTRDGVGRALAEVARRRGQGQETNLSSVLLAAGVLNRETLDRLQREVEKRPARAAGQAPAHFETQRLDADPPGVIPRPKAKTGRFDAGPPPAPPPQAPPRPAPVIPTPPSLGAAPTAKTLGRQWGPYEILGEVARGAMGAVYRARDKRRGGQEVALKVLLQGSKADGEDIERFKREARSLARLAHPSIVRVYDYGVHEGCPFITMDFVAGTTLESILAGGGMAVERGLVILEEVARAVDHAHSRGVVHRDLKPANVLIGTDNRARITDFGLAKILDEGGRLTRDGDLIGTPLYMSPEQIRGDLLALGASSDTWSLGVTLYYLLTGQQPFGAKTIEEVSKRILHEEPIPPRTMRPNVHEDLERITLAALQKDPKLRYQSAGEFARDLSNYLQGKPVLAGRVTFGVRLRRLGRSLRLRLGLRPVLVLGLGLATSLAAVATFAASRGAGPAPPPPRLASASLGDLQKLVARLGSSDAPLGDAFTALSEELGRADQMPRGEAEDRDAKALLAQAHFALGRRAPGAREAIAHLLKAVDLAPFARGDGRGTELVDKRRALERAVEPLEALGDAEQSRRAHQLLQIMGEDAAGPLVSARLHALVGDWPSVRRAAAAARAKGGRSDAVLLEVEALLALEQDDAALALASDERAAAQSEAATGGDAALLRQLALEVAEARVRARAARSREKNRRDTLESIERRLASIESRDEKVAAPVRAALAVEWARLLVASGQPRAALHELGRARPRDRRALVVGARARALCGDPSGADEALEGLRALGDDPAVPVPDRVEAATARAELALVLGSKRALADAEEELRRLAAGTGRAARRAALEATAATIDRAIVAIAARARWTGRPEALPGGDVLALVERAAAGTHEPPASADEHDAIGRFLLLGLAGAPLDEAARRRLGAVASSAGERDAPRLAANLAVTIGSGDLDRGLWAEEAGDVHLDPQVVLRFAPPFADEGPASVLVARALDRAALVRAKLPTLARWLEGGRAPVAGLRETAEPLLAEAERLLLLAGRREPFSPRVRRARARVAHDRARVALVAGEPADRLADVQATGVGEAAAAVVLDPFDRASIAKLLRATLPLDREAARRWALRGAVAPRDAECEPDRWLIDVVLGATSRASEDAAWCYAIAGNVERARALASEVPAPRAPAKPDRALDWARTVLEREAALDAVFAIGDADEARDETPDLLARGARILLDALASAGTQNPHSAAEGRSVLGPELLEPLRRASRRRPDALAPRALLALAGVASESLHDLVEARDALARLDELVTARLGPDAPSLPRVLLAIADARLERKPLPPERLLDARELQIVTQRWNLRRG